MIGFCEGTALSTQDLLTAGGVGYRLRTVNDLVVGDRYELWVSTQVRETAITLFAFATADERAVFEALCTVQGVGPAAALGVLSSCTVSELAAAVAAKDAKTVQRAKGVGGATAQRIVNDLKMPDGINVEVAATAGPGADVINTLVEMGFDRTDVVAAVQDASQGDVDVDTLLTGALHRLSVAVAS